MYYRTRSMITHDTSTRRLNIQGILRECLNVYFTIKCLPGKVPFDLFPFSCTADCHTSVIKLLQIWVKHPASKFINDCSKGFIYAAPIFFVIVCFISSRLPGLCPTAMSKEA